jgi:hypothetical protein
MKSVFTTQNNYLKQTNRAHLRLVRDVEASRGMYLHVLLVNKWAIPMMR